MNTEIRKEYLIRNTVTNKQEKKQLIYKQYSVSQVDKDHYEKVQKWINKIKNNREIYKAPPKIDIKYTGQFNHQNIESSLKLMQNLDKKAESQFQKHMN